MKYYVSKRSFYKDGRTYEPGEVIPLPDDYPNGRHFDKVKKEAVKLDKPSIHFIPCDRQGKPLDGSTPPAKAESSAGFVEPPKPATEKMPGQVHKPGKRSFDKDI